MSTSANSDERRLVLHRDEERYDHISLDVTDAEELTLFVRALPSVNFYQWYDIDLRLLAESLKQYENDADVVEPTAETLLASGWPPVESILLIFIRYLQLLSLVPWSSPVSISDRPYQPPKRKEADVTASITSTNKKQKKKQTQQPGLCGLMNIGNTCFMNSALQCLSNIPQLNKWATTYEPSNNRMTVTKAYVSLMKSMWSGTMPYVTPSDIKQRVSQYASIFSDFAQKDSHEFMNSLLNALQSEFEGDQPSSEQSSIVTSLFGIQTESGVTCLTCNTRDAAEEITYCLPLALANEPEMSLDTLLNDFLKEELLDGQYYCSTCEGLVLAKQKTTLRHPLPPVIIVQLKRFTFDETNDKLTALVKYPLVDWKVDHEDNSLYDLVAVSRHVGNLKGGHYTTYARLNASDQWYHFNDSSYERVADTSCLVNRNAYVLVYLRKN